MKKIKEKLNSFFLLDEIEEKVQPDKTSEKNSSNKVIKNISSPNKEITNYEKQKNRGENIVAIHSKNTNGKKPQITIVEPRLYSEVQEVSDYLLSNESVIINFRRMENEQATKMIDFLMGVTYAINGDIQRLGEKLFVCTPQSVELNGSDLSDFKESLL